MGVIECMVYKTVYLQTHQNAPENGIIEKMGCQNIRKRKRRDGA